MKQVFKIFILFMLIAIFTNFSLAQKIPIDKDSVEVFGYDIDTNHNNRTTYYIDEAFIQERITNGTILNYTYYYANNKMYAMKDYDGKMLYYHPDHLGSTTLVTNETGDVVEEISYLPFGNTLIGSDEAQRFLFNNKEKDKEFK